jgi:hypothetical protein
MTQQMQPVRKAVLVAPISAPLAVTGAMAWEAVAVSGVAGFRDVPLAALIVFAFGLPISYAAMLVFGLPYVLWLRAGNRLNWIYVCIGAAVLGSVTWTSCWHFGYRPPSVPKSLAIGAAIGLLVGVVFCWVAGLKIRSRQASQS